MHQLLLSVQKIDYRRSLLFSFSESWASCGPQQALVAIGCVCGGRVACGHISKRKFWWRPRGPVKSKEDLVGELREQVFTAGEGKEGDQFLVVHTSLA